MKKNILKEKLHKYLLNEIEPGERSARAGEAMARDLRRRTGLENQPAKPDPNAPDSPPSVDPNAPDSDPATDPNAPDSDPPSRRRGGGGSSYRRYSGDAVPFGRSSDLVRQVQQALSDISGEYTKILQVGDVRYGGVQTSWDKPVDGNYGPRTNSALMAFYAIEKSQTRQPKAPITKDDLTQIKTVTSQSSKMTPAKAEQASEKIANTGNAGDGQVPVPVPVPQTEQPKPETKPETKKERQKIDLTKIKDSSQYKQVKKIHDENKDKTMIGSVIQDDFKNINSQLEKFSKEYNDGTKNKEQILKEINKAKEEVNSRKDFNIDTAIEFKSAVKNLLTYLESEIKKLTESKQERNDIINDYFINPIKDRHNRIQKLVFERLVKGCK